MLIGCYYEKIVLKKLIIKIIVKKIIYENLLFIFKQILIK